MTKHASNSVVDEFENPENVAGEEANTKAAKPKKGKPVPTDGEEPVKRKRKDTNLKLLELKIKHMTVRIEGISPLITHNWSEKIIRQIEDKQGGKAREAKGPKVPEEECHAARYLNELGQDCIPARAVKAAMVTAATSINDKVNYPKTKIRQGLFIIGDLLPLILERPFEMRRDMVRVGMGNADVRYRPEYANWAVDLPIEYNSSVFSAEEIVNMLQLAGFSVGISEWRPEKDGSNGRFRVRGAATDDGDHAIQADQQ